MKRRSLRNSVAAAIVLVTVSASGVAAQQDTSPAPKGHSVWRDVLIGSAVGAGFGAGIGAMRSNFHNTECVVLTCNRVLEAEALIPIGAAIGAFGGWMTRIVLNRVAQRASSTPPPVAASTTSRRQPMFLVSPTYSLHRKGIQLRAQF